MSKPDFIDNRNGNTLAQALGAVLNVNADGGFGEVVASPDQVRIATVSMSV